MAIHWEPLAPEHVPLCAPLWSDRRAYTAAELTAALERLQRLLREERAIGAVVIEDECVRGFGVTVFVESDVVDRLLSSPGPQFGKRLLLEDHSRPEQSAVLDRRRIGRGNAANGLDLVVVNTNFDDRSRDADSVIGSIMGAFQTVHRGHRIARILIEANGERAIGVVVTSHSFELSARFDNVGGIQGQSSGLFTLTRCQALAWRNPLQAMFVYSPPRIFFTEAEQRILRVALSGKTDAAIARQLAVPLTAVKSRWSRLQDRAFAAAADHFTAVATRGMAAGRGPQIRHLILEYVRRHPSELSPYLPS